METITRAAGGVAVTLRGDGRRLEVTLRGSTVLARDLEALGRALWAARSRAVLDAAGMAAEPVVAGWRAEAYVAGRAAIVARGRSLDGLVAVQATGMRRWRVHVAPGASAAAVREAGEALIEDQERQIRALKRTIWQPEGTGNARRASESWWDVPRTGGSQ
jgi:hypothetical protein